MAIVLTWDNTALLANSNVIAQRASQRLKIIGGTFYTTGFTPANDLSPSLNTVNLTTFINNKIYELKVEAICTSGGPTINNNGIKEGIVFGCITPAFTPIAATTATMSINVTGTDLEGAIITLRKQSDNSIVSGPTDVPAVAGFIGVNYTGLITITDYYVTVYFYTTIEGVKTIAPDFCGGNTTGYQFSTV